MHRVIAFQHTPAEPLGYLEHLLEEWNVPYDYIRLWETNEVPRVDASHLVFLGGPMSVNDEAEFPYLVQEKALIRRSLKGNLPVLGLCLGAQLIASALGAKVFRYVNETGWYPVTRLPAAGSMFTGFPDRFFVFQFHAETFGIPYGAELLCTGETVRHQAFRFRRALALQFHLEMTMPLVADWCRDLPGAKNEKIMRDTGRWIGPGNELCRQLFLRFLTLKKQRL